jgi:hypothetical protein
MTTANLSLAPQTPVAVTNSSFSYTLPALSIVTFAGQVDLPVLTITYSSNGVTVSGPTRTADRDILLQSPTLNPAKWSTNTSPITTVNGTNKITITSPTGNWVWLAARGLVCRRRPRRSVFPQPRECQQ